MLRPSFQRLPRFKNFCVLLCRTFFVSLIALGISQLFPPSAHAQGGVPLVTVATDQSPLDLSNQFGPPQTTAINQAGDFAFIGNGSSAIFFRAAGAPSATRLLQVGDPVPGFPGSQIQSFSPVVVLNSAKSILFAVSFNLPDGLPHGVILVCQSGSYRTVASSDDIAPGSGGVTYGSALMVGGINDSGDVSFAAVPTGKTATTFYIVPSGGAAVR